MPKQHLHGPDEEEALSALTLRPGQMLAHYRLVEKIGEGGMGVVFRAEDTLLKRPAALKLLTGSSWSDAGRRSRFLREAQLAASLNHPNICTIYQVSEVSTQEATHLPSGEPVPAGVPFIAMELIEGRSLQQALKLSKRLPLIDLLRVALQVAEGLAAAHSRNIVHRDLKPGNVMLTGEGRVKILDFGLAKPAPSGGMDPHGLTEAPTIGPELTGPGVILGTGAYMSPEQARGREVDSRSDVFSFGVMLYELTAGVRPFQGDSPLSTTAKILESEPESLGSLRGDTPDELQNLVHRCLRKRPEDRFGEAAELIQDLREILRTVENGSSDESAAAIPRDSRADRDDSAGGIMRWAWPPVRPLTTILAGAVILVLGIVITPRLLPPKPATTAALSQRQLTFSGASGTPAISRNGEWVAYHDHGALMVQDLSGGSPVRVTDLRRPYSIRWSPDGSEILVSGPESFILPRLGGERRPLPGSLVAAWSPGGRRVAIVESRKKIDIIDLSGDRDTTLTLQGDFIGVLALDWSPDGKWLLFTTSGGGDAGFGLWVVRPDGRDQILLKAVTSMVEPARWSEEGREIYWCVWADETWEVRKSGFDPGSRSLAPETRVVMAGLQASRGFDLTPDGRRLVYTRSLRSSTLRLMELNPDGASNDAPARDLTSGKYVFTDPRFSPDGRFLAYVRMMPAGVRSEIFIRSMETGASRQLTFLEANSIAPSWSPDGSRIAFLSTEGETKRLWIVNSDGTNASPVDQAAPRGKRRLAWAPGERILYDRGTASGFQLLDPETGQESALSGDAPSGEMDHPVYSRDGRRVALVWDRAESSRARGMGIWVIDLDSGDSNLVHDHGDIPLGWSPDNRWIYAVHRSDLIRIPSEGGEPQPAHILPEYAWPDDFALSPDASRLVASFPSGERDLWLVENFDSGAE